jgi:hypothetical protein
MLLVGVLVTCQVMLLATNPRVSLFVLPFPLFLGALWNEVYQGFIINKPLQSLGHARNETEV